MSLKQLDKSMAERLALPPEQLAASLVSAGIQLADGALAPDYRQPHVVASVDEAVTYLRDNPLASQLFVPEADEAAFDALNLPGWSFVTRGHVRGTTRYAYYRNRIASLAESIRALYLADSRPSLDVAVPPGIDPSALVAMIGPSSPEGPELLGAVWYEVEPAGGPDAVIAGERAYRIVVARTEYDACAAAPESYDSEAVIEAYDEARRGVCR